MHPDPEGIEHSPLVEHYFELPSISVCTLFSSVCNPRMVAETGIFFHKAQLLPGSAMTLSFPAETEAAILPHDAAGKVPFENLANVLATFNIPAGSDEAVQVRDTLRRYQEAPVAGEVKACATSLESTVRSAMAMLGTVNEQGVWAARRSPAAACRVRPTWSGRSPRWTTTATCPSIGCRRSLTPSTSATLRGTGTELMWFRSAASAAARQPRRSHYYQNLNRGRQKRLIKEFFSTASDARSR